MSSHTAAHLTLKLGGPQAEESRQVAQEELYKPVVWVSKQEYEQLTNKLILDPEVRCTECRGDYEDSFASAMGTFLPFVQVWTHKLLVIAVKF